MLTARDDGYVGSAARQPRRDIAADRTCPEYANFHETSCRSALASLSVRRILSCNVRG
jgi:hypothetical protein